MKREAFFNYIKEDILNFLPEEYKEAEVSIHDCKGNNDTKVSKLYIRRPNKMVIPGMFLEPYYLMIQNNHPIYDVLQKIAEDYIDCECPDLEVIKDGMNVNNIFFHVVNKEKNRSLLKNIPHRDFLDLAVIYRVLIKREKDGISSCIINSDIMKDLKIETEEELFEKANKNTFDLFPVNVSSMKEVLSELSSFPFIDDDPFNMHIVTNTISMYGASELLNKESFKKLSETYGNCDLWILPSSIHEVIAIPVREDGHIEQLGLAEMIFEVNSSQVADEEVLSNSPYRYSNAKNCIELTESFL